jgi:trans-AT polyketide synthase/acyltransferase/oxidoreductase domain-containing protein
MSGAADRRVDYQVACGPAMGALNGFLRGTPHEHWRDRHADVLAELLMTGAAAVLERQLAGYAAQPSISREPAVVAAR